MSTINQQFRPLTNQHSQIISQVSFTNSLRSFADQPALKLGALSSIKLRSLTNQQIQISLIHQSHAPFSTVSNNSSIDKLTSLSQHCTHHPTVSANSLSSLANQQYQINFIQWYQVTFNSLLSLTTKHFHITLFQPTVSDHWLTKSLRSLTKFQVSLNQQSQLTHQPTVSHHWPTNNLRSVSHDSLRSFTTNCLTHKRTFPCQSMIWVSNHSLTNHHAQPQPPVTNQHSQIIHDQLSPITQSQITNQQTVSDHSPTNSLRSLTNQLPRITHQPTISDHSPTNSFRSLTNQVSDHSPTKSLRPLINKQSQITHQPAISDQSPTNCLGSLTNQQSQITHQPTVSDHSPINSLRSLTNQQSEITHQPTVSDHSPANSLRFLHSQIHSKTSRFIKKNNVFLSTCTSFSVLHKTTPEIPG